MGGERRLLPDSGSRWVFTHLHLPQYTSGGASGQMERGWGSLCTLPVIQEENKEEGLCFSLLCHSLCTITEEQSPKTLQTQQPLTPGYFRTDSLWRHARKRKRGAGQVHCGKEGAVSMGQDRKGRGQRKATASPLTSLGSALPSFVPRHRLLEATRTLQLQVTKTQLNQLKWTASS